jgi:hypothetical protein
MRSSGFLNGHVDMQIRPLLKGSESTSFCIRNIPIKGFNANP